MHTRTTTTAASLLTAGLLVLTGCSSGSSTPAKTSPPASSSPVPTVALRDQFLQQINAANIASWGRHGPSDDELAAYPDQWCAQLAYGHSVAWMFDIHQGDLYPLGQDWGTEQADAFKVLVMAVGVFCPDKKPVVLGELRATGNY